MDHQSNEILTLVITTKKKLHFLKHYKAKSCIDSNSSTRSPFVIRIGDSSVSFPRLLIKCQKSDPAAIAIIFR